jgi:hypothetical protein
VDDFVVYRSRNASAAVTVGSAAGNDIHYQNPSPAQAAGSISSIVKDSSYNISAVNTQTLNVDWTAPYCPGLVSDGVAADVDTVNSATQLSANWSAAVDTNSAIAYYEYAIGTAPGLQNVVAFTNNGNATSVTKSGLSLSTGQHYYFTVHAYDGAGLVCNAANSDGVIVLTTTGISTASVEGFRMYPNPSSGVLYVESATGISDIQIMDMMGREVKSVSFKNAQGKISLDLGDLPDGTYFVRANTATAQSILGRLVVGRR